MGTGTDAYRVNNLVASHHRLALYAQHTDRMTPQLLVRVFGAWNDRLFKSAL